MAEAPTRMKDQLRTLLQALPDDASWDDLLYRIHVIRKIERAIDDSTAGRTRSYDEVLREFGI
jgi:hypothetical protein